jgi:hypothetical protein
MDSDDGDPLLQQGKANVKYATYNQALVLCCTAPVLSGIALGIGYDTITHLSRILPTTFGAPTVARVRDASK